jgi:hypothetical protein
LSFAHRSLSANVPSARWSSSSRPRAMEIVGISGPKPSRERVSRLETMSVNQKGNETRSQ